MIKRTFKGLLSQLFYEVGDYHYYEFLDSFKSANLTIDEMNEKIKSLLETAIYANRHYTGKHSGELTWKDLSNKLEELNLEIDDIDEEDWDELDEYFNNLEHPEKETDILLDKIFDLYDEDRKSYLEHLDLYDEDRKSYIEYLTDNVEEIEDENEKLTRLKNFYEVFSELKKNYNDEFYKLRSKYNDEFKRLKKEKDLFDNYYF